MVLMGVMAVLLVTGLALTLRWGDVPYRPWEAGSAHLRDGADRPPPGEAVRRYLRGVAIALVAGFWTGLLVTGPAMRLIMRLLAVTSGDRARGGITEADEVVGRIELEGTLGLLVFGGILPSLLSGALYVVGRRLLPEGRLGGVAFGVLHLVLVATRVDPLRPDNRDFELLGPGWLSVLTFGAAVVVHGMAVAAFADRYSREVPQGWAALRRRTRALVPLVPAVLLLLPAAPVLLPVAGGLVLAVAVSRSAALAPRLGSDASIRAARAVVVAIALVLLPGTVSGLRDVLVADERGAVEAWSTSPSDGTGDPAATPP